MNSGSCSSRSQMLRSAGARCQASENWTCVFSRVEVRGNVSSEPFVGEGSAGELVAFLLSDEDHVGRPDLTCEIICEGALAHHALTCVVEGARVVVTGALRASQPPGLEGSDLCVLRVEAQTIECA